MYYRVPNICENRILEIKRWRMNRKNIVYLSPAEFRKRKLSICLICHTDKPKDLRDFYSTGYSVCGDCADNMSGKEMMEIYWNMKIKEENELNANMK